MIQKILKRAWQITWKNKFLWFFGLLIVLFGQGSETNFFLNNLQIINNQTANLFNWNKVFSFLENFKVLFISHPFQVILFFLILIVLVLIVIFINLSSQGSLIYCSKKLSQNKKSTFIEGAHIGIKNFWALLVIFILANLFILISFLIFVLPFTIFFIKNNSPLWFFLSLLSSLLILLPISILVYLITRFAYCYLVLKSKKILSSIEKSIKLFLKNWLIILKFALFLSLIYILGIIIIALVSFLISLPLFLISIMLNYLISFDISWSLMVIGVITSTILSLFIISILTVFQYNSWVLLFSELVGHKKE